MCTEVCCVKIWIEIFNAFRNAVIPDNWCRHTAETVVGVVKAVELITSSALKGCALGQYNLAHLYEDGELLPQDIEKAIELYTLAAEQGDANAQFNLALIYEDGELVQRDIEKAIELVLKGAKLIGTNPDITGPTEKGIMPATGSLIAPIEIATGKKAYFVGKPNPVMLRHGLRKLGCHSEEIAFIGDRMDTDIIAGIESGATTVLVLSGVSTRQTVEQFPYGPNVILNDVGEIVE